jgi:hypothetical protein
MSAEPETVQDALASLSAEECLQNLDVLMSRRPPYSQAQLAAQIALWRRERCAWGDARDQRRAAKETEE